MNEKYTLELTPSDAMVVVEGMKQVMLADGYDKTAKNDAFYIALNANNIANKIYEDSDD